GRPRAAGCPWLRSWWRPTRTWRASSLRRWGCPSLTLVHILGLRQWHRIGVVLLYARDPVVVVARLVDRDDARLRDAVPARADARAHEDGDDAGLRGLGPVRTPGDRVAADRHLRVGPLVLREVGLPGPGDDEPVAEEERGCRVLAVLYLVGQVREGTAGVV